ncbi:MAG: DMT family transporter [Planctomycetota bacterium]|jgi:drug/metabolite transporter (DMT)-like permease
MALSAVCFSLMGVSIKLLTRGTVDQSAIPAMEIVFWRGALCALITLWMMPRKLESLLGQRTGLLVLRGLCGFTGLLLYVTALGEIHYSTATALLYTHPMFTALFAALLLREHLPRIGVVAMVICLAGALVILDPRIEGGLAGGLMGLGAGMASGLAYTLVRGLSRTESTYTIVMSFHVIAAIVAGLLMIPDFVLPTGQQWLWIALVAVLAQAGQVFLTQGLTAERAGTATTVSYITVALAALWGWTFFAEALTVTMGVGVVLLVVGLRLMGRSRSQTS